MWATYSREGAQPPGHLQIYRRGRGRLQIVSLQGSASSTETAMKWHYSSWCNHLRSTRLDVFGPFQLYGFYLWFRGPTLLKCTLVGNELGVDKPFLEFEGTWFINLSDLFALAVILSIWDFQLSLLEISTSKYLALLTASSTCAYSKHCPWGGHPHNLTLGVVKFHMSRDMRFQKMWYFWPAKAQISLAHTSRLIRAFACRLNILWLLSYWQNIIWSFYA